MGFRDTGCYSVQALKGFVWAWYAMRKTFLPEHGYVMGSVDKTLFTLNHGIAFFTYLDLRGCYHLW
jgi:hypothetical protein